MTSTYFEGRHCPLARRGHSRDGKRGSLQIMFALLCAGDGCPVAVEVFEGNTAGPGTLGGPLKTLCERFGLSKVAVVGDRGLLTSARIREEVEPAGWTGSRRCGRRRSRSWRSRAVFSRRCSTSATWPRSRRRRCIRASGWSCAGTRCWPRERARKRADLLAATEAKLEQVAEAVRRERRPLRGEARIAVRADRALRSHKVGKRFVVRVTDDAFSHARAAAAIAREAALDGLYVRAAHQRGEAGSERGGRRARLTSA